MRIYELTPVDGRKSFYGKCQVFDYENGRESLKSYNTIVAHKVNGEYYRDADYRGWTQTTGRHIAAFCGCNKSEFFNLPTIQF